MHKQTSIVERWLPVVGYEGKYEISNRGGVRSLMHSGEGVRKEPLVMKPYTMPTGHRRVCLMRSNKQDRALVHRLVLAAFVCAPPPKAGGRHLNGDPGDNRVENLCWGTQKENMQDRERHGNTPHGERSGMSKLSSADVYKIRATPRTMNNREVGDMFGVTSQTIRMIRAGKMWRHLL